MKVFAFIVVLMLSLLSFTAVTAGLLPRQRPADSTPTFAVSHSSQRLIASGDCQSRIWGKLLAENSLPIRDIQVVLDGDAQKLKARPDANGLYGFTGLCAGKYGIHLQSGDRVIALPQRFEMHGHNETRQDIAVP